MLLQLIGKRNFRIIICWFTYWQYWQQGIKIFPINNKLQVPGVCRLSGGSMLNWSIAKTVIQLGTGEQTVNTDNSKINKLDWNIVTGLWPSSDTWALFVCSFICSKHRTLHTGPDTIWLPLPYLSIWFSWYIEIGGDLADYIQIWGAWHLRF